MLLLFYCLHTSSISKEQERSDTVFPLNFLQILKLLGEGGAN